MQENPKPKPYAPWTPEDIDKLLELLPILEAPEFEICTWPKLEPRIEDGVKVMQMPYPIYHEVVDRYWEVLYGTSAICDPYAALPEDPTRDGIEFEVLGTSFPPEYFQTATLDQARRYLVLCTRGERFCSGHIADEFQSGCLLAALRRVKELRNAMGKTRSA